MKNVTEMGSSNGLMDNTTLDNGRTVIDMVWGSGLTNMVIAIMASGSMARDRGMQST